MTVMSLLLLLFTHHTSFLFFFFFNDTATTEIYTLSLHDALPISGFTFRDATAIVPYLAQLGISHVYCSPYFRSEEHTSELQSRLHLVCRLLLEKKKKTNKTKHIKEHPD